MEDKELLEKLKTEEGLKERGYKKITCNECHGVGQQFKEGIMVHCFTCKGKGYKWIPPLMC